MSTINKPYVSDSALSYVKLELAKRTVGVDVEYYALCAARFNGNHAVTKEVPLSELTQAERDAGLLFYNAVHAAAPAKVTVKDFK